MEVVRKEKVLRKRKLLAIAITISLMLITLTGCTTYQNFKAAFIGGSIGDSVTLTIGVYEPITGGDSKAAESEIRGIQLANEVYPNINGKVVDIVYSDNNSDVNASESAIKNLISYKPDVILGSYGSVYSMEASKYVKEAKIPTIAISNTNPLVTKNNPYYYRVCIVDSNQGDLLGQYLLNSKKAKSAGVLLPKGDEVALARASSFTDRMEGTTNNSDAIKVYKQYVSGESDYTKQLKAVKKSGVKYVFLPTDNTNDAIEIIKEAKKMNLDVQFLGCSEWSYSDFTKMASKIVDDEDLAYISYIDPTLDSKGASSSVSDETQKFLEAYHKKYGKDATPDENTALGYDAYVIAINAASSAGDNPTGKEIKRVLDGSEVFQGVSGTIQFNNVGDPIKTAYISTLSKGNQTLLYTIKPKL